MYAEGAHGQRTLRKGLPTPTTPPPCSTNLCCSILELALQRQVPPGLGSAAEEGRGGGSLGRQPNEARRAWSGQQKGPGAGRQAALTPPPTHPRSRRGSTEPAAGFTARKDTGGEACHPAWGQSHGEAPRQCPPPPCRQPRRCPPWPGGPAATPHTPASRPVGSRRRVQQRPPLQLAANAGRCALREEAGGQT